MNKLTKIAAGLVILVMCGSVAAEQLETEIGFDFFGKYVWRGQNVTDEPVFQPWVTLGYGGLTAELWGNLDLTNINGDEGDFNEYNWALDYSGDLEGGIGYSVGVIHYYFPSDGDTTEIYAGLSLDALLSPSLTVYYDVDDVEGFYIFAGAEHGIEKIAELTPEIPIGMELTAGIGWGDKDYTEAYWDVDSSKLQDLTFGMSFPMEIAGWTVSPNLNYVTLTSGSLRRTNAYSTSSDYFFAGVGVSKSF